MATLRNIPFTLSIEEAMLFESLQGSALLPTLAVPGEGELVKVFKQKKREEEAKLMAPYADLLEHELKGLMAKSQATILQKLSEAKGTSFSLDLLSWKTVFHNETLSCLKDREAEMTPSQRATHNQAKWEERTRIRVNGWESYFGVQTTDGWNETFDVLESVKVDRIFRHSDLMFRLSLALGPNFYPSIRYQAVEVPGSEWNEHSFEVTRKILTVTYYPFGVSKKQITKLLSVAKTQAERTASGGRTTLAPGESGFGHEEMLLVKADPTPPVVEWGAFLNPEAGRDDMDYSDMPPLIPAAALSSAGAQVRLVGGRIEGRCFCGCSDEE